MVEKKILYRTRIVECSATKKIGFTSQQKVKYSQGNFAAILS
jgi:hypothetical protein